MKFLGICILISALLISCAMVFNVIFEQRSNVPDRYSFYVDAARHTVYTFDKFTGECSKKNTDTFETEKWNDTK